MWPDCPGARHLFWWLDIIKLMSLLLTWFDVLLLEGHSTNELFGKNPCHANFISFMGNLVPLNPIMASLDFNLPPPRFFRCNSHFFAAMANDYCHRQFHDLRWKLCRTKDTLQGVWVEVQHFTKDWEGWKEK